MGHVHAAIRQWFAFLRVHRQDHSGNKRPETQHFSILGTLSSLLVPKRTIVQLEGCAQRFQQPDQVMDAKVPKNGCKEP